MTESHLPKDPKEWIKDLEKIWQNMDAKKLLKDLQKMHL